jgi:hypothetical protein
LAIHGARRGNRTFITEVDRVLEAALHPAPRGASLTLRLPQRPKFVDYTANLLVRGGVEPPTFRFQAGHIGRAGFGAAAVLGLCFTMSLGLIAMAFAGPFLLFGLGLLVAGIWQRNRFLAWWAVLIGGTGVFEGFFGITNRLSSSVWREWEHPAIYLVLALLTVLAGLIARRQENRAR